MEREGTALISPLSIVDLKDICAFVHARTGMTFGETKRYYVERRIHELMRVRGSITPQDYLAVLRTDDMEVEKIINSFTVNETYFYREEHQLACLSRSILPEVVRTKRPGDRIRIWSMPCSTGEEPYSIAIWLLENWQLVDTYHVEIVVSDIDTAVLRQAKDANYGERALSKLPVHLIEGYFEAQLARKHMLIGDLKESVTFTKANILDPGSLAASGRFDVIFCRNLLIYFDDEGRQLAANNLHELLNPGGYICLGHSESMARISDRFDIVRFPDAIVYRRGGGGV